ncbi:MAG: ABC transporter substrate-binding protein [Oscillospiraceae bacterium]|nr:ABC transporter substrate-binding protein [Oscillospiraceae bacterium]
MKKYLFSLLTLLILTLAACGKADREPETPREHVVTVGFSQVGAESDWRLASTSSMTEACSEAGYNLILDNARQKQENQFRAVREFIDQRVDYIVIDPITETGWESTLRDAAQAEIPVIIVDREVAVDDGNLYAAWIGENFELEGEKACAWLQQFLELEGLKEVNIVHIRGTENSSAQMGRTKALLATAGRCGWNIIASGDGDFVQAKGRDVMEAMLIEHGRNIQVVYCENDNMAYGVLQALDEAGIRVGTDIRGGEVLVISFDATRTGLQYTLSGQIGLNVECSPLYGGEVVALIERMVRGEETEHRIYLEESQFSTFAGIRELHVNDAVYEIEMLTEELIAARAY